MPKLFHYKMTKKDRNLIAGQIKNLSEDIRLKRVSVRGYEMQRGFDEYPSSLGITERHPNNEWWLKLHLVDERICKGKAKEK